MSAALRAGAGRARAAIPADVWPLEGFSDEHDPLFVRVLVLDAPRRIVLAVLDQTSLLPEAESRVRSELVAVTGADPADVLTAVSHSFSVPHLHPHPDASAEERRRLDRMAAAVMAAVRAAAADAVEGLRPAAVGGAYAVCGIGVNRDVDTAAGWTLGVDETGITDPVVPTIRIVGEDGTGIATVMVAAVQPAVMHESAGADGTRLATSDLAGAAAAGVEAGCGGVAFFLPGAAGDQSPALTARRSIRHPSGTVEIRDAGEAGFVLVELLGERFAEAVLRTVRDVDAFDPSPSVTLTGGSLTVPGQEPRRREDIRPSRTGDYAPAPDRTLPYRLLRLGDLALVGFQVELSAATGIGIRAGSPFAVTAVASMVDGSAKYLPDAAGFDRFGYEAQSSQYARGAAELAAAAVLRDLAALREG